VGDKNSTRGVNRRLVFDWSDPQSTVFCCMFVLWGASLPTGPLILSKVRAFALSHSHSHHTHTTKVYYYYRYLSLVPENKVLVCWCVEVVGVGVLRLLVLVCLLVCCCVWCVATHTISLEEKQVSQGGLTRHVSRPHQPKQRER
jgi:hypothetical protein